MFSGLDVSVMSPTNSGFVTPIDAAACGDIPRVPRRKPRKNAPGAVPRRRAALLLVIDGFFRAVKGAEEYANHAVVINQSCIVHEDAARVEYLGGGFGAGRRVARTASPSTMNGECAVPKMLPKRTASLNPAPDIEATQRRGAPRSRAEDVCTFSEAGRTRVPSAAG